MEPTSVLQAVPKVATQDFWGDKVVLYTMSYMWSMKITVLNTKTLQKYRIHHDRALDDVDVVLMFNTVNHFNATGG